MLKKILILFLLIPSLIKAEIIHDKYFFAEYELPDNLVKSGSIDLTKNTEGFYDFDVKVIGSQSSYIFKTTKKISSAPFNIFDIRAFDQVMGISIFTLSIDPSRDFSQIRLDRNVEMLDRNHPFFSDQSMNVYVTFKGNEKITLSNKVFDAIYFQTSGDRPTGPGHCMYGGVGVFGVDSWYSKENGKLLKQIFIKRNCRPYDYKILSKEVLELIPYDSNYESSPESKEIKLSLENAKEKCTSFGLKPKTEKFGVCVLELIK